MRGRGPEPFEGPRRRRAYRRPSTGRIVTGEQVTSTAAAHADEWELVWADEFDYSGEPDGSKWIRIEAFRSNQNLECYTPAGEGNVRVEDGTLVIEAKKERYPNPAYDPKETENPRTSCEYAEYTSGCIMTKGKAHWRYGRIEVRAKLPTGRGMWPAIWMLGADASEVGWPACGEIDIMENVGYDPDLIHATIHTKKYNHVQGTQKGSRIRIPEAHRDFHVYAVEWDATEINFFVDDWNYFTFKNEGAGGDSWPFDREHYLILNIAVGGAWGGAKGVDDGVFPQRFHVDYVRVYRKKDGQVA